MRYCPCRWLLTPNPSDDCPCTDSPPGEMCSSRASAPSFDICVQKLICIVDSTMHYDRSGIVRRRLQAGPKWNSTRIGQARACPGRWGGDQVCGGGEITRGGRQLLGEGYGKEGQQGVRPIHKRKQVHVVPHEEWVTRCDQEGSLFYNEEPATGGSFICQQQTEETGSCSTRVITI